MSPKFAKVGLTVLVLGAAFGGLFYSTLAEGTEYYKHVEEAVSYTHLTLPTILRV